MGLLEGSDRQGTASRSEATNAGAPTMVVRFLLVHGVETVARHDVTLKGLMLHISIKEKH
jgi:hypothetical protein